MEVETRNQITVKIQAPLDWAAGKYSCRLRVFVPQSPGERFTDGETVYFQVSENAVEPHPPPPKKKIKWWFLSATIADIVLVAGIIYLIITSDSDMFNNMKFK